MKEKTDEFISVCPNGKSSSCLEKLRKFSVKELQGILKHYYENISGKKQTFWWKPLPFSVVANQSYSLKSCNEIHLWIILLVAIMKQFFLINSQTQFWKMISKKYQTLIFLSYTIILLLLLRNIMLICYEKLLIKD